MQKAERMKNKMSGGKKLVTIDNIQIRFLQKKTKKNNNNNNRQDPDQVSKGLQWGSIGAL